MTFDPLLLSRIEDAGLNASAPPQQRWMDGWLLRFSPGKAKRARCVNAVANGRLPLAQKLDSARAVFAEAGLPLLFRITPFTEPVDLDAGLEAMGHPRLDDTRVMVLPELTATSAAALPYRCRAEAVDPQAFAQQVGEFRGSPLAQRQAHARRLEFSPVPYQAFVIVRDSKLIAGGQFALERDLVGLYDIFTMPHARGRGFGKTLCLMLLAEAHRRGARHAYLQVEADNLPARRLYRGLGFADAYAYHYRGIDTLSAAADGANAGPAPR